MTSHRSVWSRFRSFGLVGVIGVALVLTAVAEGWSGTGGQHSGTPQFTLRAIPVSAVHHSWGQVPRIRNANGSSSNWSGYAAYPSTQTQSPSGGGKGKGNGKGNPGGKKSSSTPTFSDVTGSWTVPEVTGSVSASTYSSSWVGLDGYSDGTVEQIGTEQDWSGGSPHYYAWFEMYPKFGYQIVGFPVNPGDEISADVQYVSKGNFALTITNVTEGVSFTTNQREHSAQRLSAEWIEEAPWSGGVLPLADFGTVDFFDCSASMGNHTGTIDDILWQFDSITMQTSGGASKAVPSDLSSGGADFTVTWEHE